MNGNFILAQTPPKTNSPARHDKDALYWKLRRENDDFLKRQAWYSYHALNGSLVSQKRQAAQALARQAETIVADHLVAQGYQVNFTPHNAPFDLWIADDRGRAASVEVKISTYRESSKGGRYQATISKAEHIWADLVIFIARNGRDWPFVIPMSAIRPRRNIALWSYCPGDYTGQWSPYLEEWGGAWSRLDQTLATAPPRAWQLSLIP